MDNFWALSEKQSFKNEGAPCTFWKGKAEDWRSAIGQKRSEGEFEADPAKDDEVREATMGVVQKTRR